MTIVWIVSRDMHRVKSMVSEGVSRLNVFDVIAELSVGGKEAGQELFNRLQTGQLPAWGVPKTGEVYVEIPPIMWLELHEHHADWRTDDIGTSSDLITITESRILNTFSSSHTHTQSGR